LLLRSSPSSRRYQDEMKDLFRRFSHKTSVVLGSPLAFFAAVAVILAWIITGPLFGFTDTWQLVINTGTTVVTFLMVFLIQNTQNRDAKAMHLKLDELIRAVRGARDSLVDLEDLSDKELEEFSQEFQAFRVGVRKTKTGKLVYCITEKNN